MTATLGRIIIYTKRLPEMAEFYCRYFGFSRRDRDGDRIVELRATDGGAHILLHPMGTGRKEGQTLVKLVFDVPDVVGFCQSAKTQGLDFGPIHQADGYVFANAKDPSGNSVSVSSRAFVYQS